MITHDLKCINPYFTDVWNGFKKFEVRNNDRNFKKGDFVILHELNRITNTNLQSRKITAEIIYILNLHELFMEDCLKNYVILGIKVIDKAGAK